MNVKKTKSSKKIVLKITMSLTVPSGRDGLLEDLIVLGHVPITKAVIRNLGLVH